MIETPAPSEAAPTPGTLSPTRQRFDGAYGYLLGVFVLAVLVQIYLAGVGAFGERKSNSSGAFNPHEDLGHYLGIAAVVLFVLALVARESKNTVIGSLVLALLTEVAQEGLAQGGHNDKWVGGLHAFDAALILGVAIWQFYMWRRRQKA
jgi:Mn2+/Fe2+ NRAMP family transporter